MDNASRKPKILSRTPGRALFIGEGGKCYISRKYDILSSENWGQSWQLDCRVPGSGWKSWAAISPPLTRLLRYHIQAFQVLDDGTRIAVACDGLYRAGPHEVLMQKTFSIRRGSRPLNLCADGSRLLFGEYGDGFDDSEILLYVSDDFGKTWNVGHRFPPHDIRHVHNILKDPIEGHYWVLVGDFNHEPGIGILSNDLKRFDWLMRGCPEVRVVGAIIKTDCLLYGTDLDCGQNHLIRFDKRSGKIEKLQQLEGSSLFASSFGSYHVISTCVEPNPTHPSRECSLYVSRDGEAWSRQFPHQKDWLHPTYFQFGCLVLPFSLCDQPRGMFSGQGVVGAHDQVTVLDFAPDDD